MVITVAVRWYLGYGLPCPDVEELPVERDVAVDHVTAYLRGLGRTPENLRQLHVHLRPAGERSLP